MYRQKKKLEAINYLKLKGGEYMTKKLWHATRTISKEFYGFELLC